MPGRHPWSFIRILTIIILRPAETKCSAGQDVGGGVCLPDAKCPRQTIDLPLVVSVPGGPEPGLTAAVCSRMPYCKGWRRCSS